MHFIHEKGSGRSPQPLLLLHGWPYSFYSFLDLIEPLAHPERFGGDAEDGFDVIVPSLPGFGFSDKPANPLGPRGIARRMDALMTRTLGYGRYIAHGGDWGSGVSNWLALDHAPRCMAIHLNAIGGISNDGTPYGAILPGPGPVTATERAALAHVQMVFERDFAYFLYQAYRPLTLSYGMGDSPVGATAWILDKFYLWSDRRARPFASIFTADHLLTEVMVYLVTRTFDTSTWVYKGFLAEDAYNLPLGRRVTVPTAMAAFPDPFLPPSPRPVAEKLYTIARWTVMPRGGHFPMVEQPALLRADIQTFGRSLR